MKHNHEGEEVFCPDTCIGCLTERLTLALKRTEKAERERDEARARESDTWANWESRVRALKEQLREAKADAERFRTALRRIANAETRPQDKESLVGRMLLACVSVAREAIKGGGTHE